jgi:hypothetical protein
MRINQYLSRTLPERWHSLCVAFLQKRKLTFPRITMNLAMLRRVPGRTVHTFANRRLGPIRVRRNPRPNNLRTLHSSLQSRTSSPPSHLGNQMTLETCLATLAACKIEPKGSLSHAPTTTDPTSWKSAIQEAPSHAATVPSEYKLTKTLVFKPKTAKSAVPIPLVLIAAEDTDTKATNVLGKQLNLKELRLASDDLIKEIFGAEKNTGKCSLDCVYIAIIRLLHTD